MWDEWAEAARIDRPPFQIIMPYPEYEYWMAGVDPSDIRKEREEYELQQWQRQEGA